jgi:hypothetical protein
LKVDLTAAEAKPGHRHVRSFLLVVGGYPPDPEPITDHHRLPVPQKAQETLETAIELLQTLHCKRLADFAKQLQDHLDELLALLGWLYEILAPWLLKLGKRFGILDPGQLAKWLPPIGCSPCSSFSGTITAFPEASVPDTTLELVCKMPLKRAILWSNSGTKYREIINFAL